MGGRNWKWKWSPREEKILRENYEELSAREIQERWLCRRSLHAIMVRISVLRRKEETKVAEEYAQRRRRFKGLNYETSYGERVLGYPNWSCTCGRINPEGVNHCRDCAALKSRWNQ